jgi:GntR family transcriptional repressor for pyruvate dehydrogenase complex
MQRSQIFSEVRPTRGFEEIAMQIQSAVYAGQLKVGDRLPNERELGEIFGVSRATLREALRLLEAFGVLEVRRGASGGAFIVEPGPERAGMLLGAFIHFRHATSEDLNEFRGTFEAETAYWAALRCTPDEARELFALVDELKPVAANANWDHFVDLDLKIHFKVAEVSKNQIRIAIMQGIHEVFRNSALAIDRRDEPEWRTLQALQVDEIAQAIARRDGEAARTLMRTHVMSNVSAGHSQ